MEPSHSGHWPTKGVADQPLQRQRRPQRPTWQPTWKPEWQARRLRASWGYILLYYVLWGAKGSSGMRASPFLNFILFNQVERCWCNMKSWWSFHLTWRALVRSTEPSLLHSVLCPFWVIFWVAWHARPMVQEGAELDWWACWKATWQLRLLSRSSRDLLRCNTCSWTPKGARPLQMLSFFHLDAQQQLTPGQWGWSVGGARANMTCCDVSNPSI